jgi:anthranilate synthase component 1
VIQGVEAARSALAAGRPGPALAPQVADTETPVAAALKLIEPGRGDFLLESVEGGSVRGRHSLIGLAPDLVFRATGNEAAINPHWLTDREAFAPCAEPALEALRGLVERDAAWKCRPSCRARSPAWSAISATRPSGWSRSSRARREPDRRARHDVRAADGGPDLRSPRRHAVPRRAGLARRRSVDRRRRADRRGRRAAGDRPAARPRPRRSRRSALTPVLAPGRYGEMVARAKEYIAAGDIFQVVLAQRFTTPFALPPFELYRALRRINPSPFLYHLDLPGFALTGSSPEILVRARDGEVTIRPIAGTRPRGKTASEDEANRASLLADPKERAEHLMLLDLGRNDVGRAAEAGSVRVTDSYTVEFYSHVMHIVSNVVGRLRPGSDALDALFAGFPAGTVSGAPKVRACQIIAELEPETRGPYAGGVGYFSPDGSMDSCIVLRTALVKDGVMHVQAGAGIVADSDPAYEQRECEAKAGALFAAAREAVARASEAGFGQ